MSLAERSRPAVFFRSGFASAERGRKNGDETPRSEIPPSRVSKRGRGAMLRAVNTFRLHEAVLERKKQWAVI
jgi:hypothetical protein